MSELDESVVIDIEFKVKDSKSADNYIGDMKQRLKQIQDTFERNSPKGNDYLKDVQKSSLETIDSLKNSVRQLGEVSVNVENSRKAFSELNQTVLQMGRGIKQGTGKYASATKEEFEALKQQLKEAKTTYREALSEAKKFTDELDSEVPRMSEASGQYRALTSAVSSTGEVMKRLPGAMKQVDKELEFINQREQASLEGLQEGYRDWVKEILDSGQTLESQEGQDARNYFHERYQAIKESYEQERLLHQAELGDADAIAKLVDLENQRLDAIKQQYEEQLKLKQQDLASVKGSTSQLYYLLRTIKMSTFVVKSMNSSIENFGKKALNVATSLIKNFLKLTNVFSLFSGTVKGITQNIKGIDLKLRDVDSTSKSIKATQSGIRQEQDGINFSLKTMVSNLLKYGLGIRSLYVLVNKLRGALSEGMVNLATQWEEVNVQMSSVITSLFQMKNAIAAAVQPILTALAPALEHVANIVTDISYKIASFIAALTGSTAYVYKAKRAQQKYVDKSKDAADTTEDQANAADDAAQAMEDETKQSEELRKELSNLDKLNVLTTDKQKEPKENKAKTKKAKDKKLKDVEDSLGDAAQDMFEKVPIDAAMADWAKKLKDLIDKLFKPIKGAWDKEGQFVMDSWKKALDAIWDLIKLIGHDFLEIWLQSKTQKIFEDLFHILGDIGLIVANLVTNFKKAWLFAGNGKVILESIRDIIGIIVHGIREAADYTVAWSKNLDFIPLVTRIRQALATQIEPAIQNIVNLLVWVYDFVFLEFLKHFIEQTAPKIVKMVGNISEAIGNIAKNLLNALKYSRMGELIVNSVEHIVDVIADTLVDITESTKKWAKELDFKPLVKSIFEFIQKCQKPIRQICELLKDIYNNVILPLAKYIIETTLPKALEIAAKIAQSIGNIAENIGKAFKESDRGKQIADSLKTIFERIGKTIEFVADKTLEWSKNVDFGPLVAAIAKFLKDCEGPIDNICTLMENFYNDIILPLATYFIETVLPHALEIVGDIMTTIGNIAGKINDSTTNSDTFKSILDNAKTIAEKIGTTIDKIVKKTKEWSENIDFEPLLKSVAGWLESAKDPLDFICSTFEKFYTDVLLPFWQYIVEEGMPKLLDKLKEINEKVDWDKLKTKVDAFLQSLEPFLEKVWDTLVELLGDLGEALAKFVESKAFENIVNKIIEWMDNSNSESMAKTIESIIDLFIQFKLIAPVAETILSVLGGLVTFILTIKQFLMMGKIASMSKDISTLTTTIANLGPQVAGLETATGGAATAAETAAETAASASATATVAAGTAGKAATAGGAAADAAGGAAAGATAAGVAATAALGVFDAAMVSYDVGKLVSIHKQWETADSNHETAVENYCTNIEKLYNTAGTKAVQDITGSKDSITTLQKELETATGTHKTEIETKLTELQNVYDKAGNEAVSTVAGTNTTLEQELERARTDYENAPHNMWEGFSGGWNHYFGENAEGGGLTGLVKDSWTEFTSTWKSILGIGDDNSASTESEKIGDATAEGFNNGFNDTFTENEPIMIQNYTDFIADSEKELEVNSPSKKTESIGKDTAEGFFKGFKEIWEKEDLSKKFKEIVDKAKKTLTQTALSGTGKAFIRGLDTAIKTGFSTIKSTVSKSISDVKQKFRQGLTFNSLKSVGSQLINGLKAGMMSALNSAYSAISSICNKIVSKAKQAFAVHSPSKVFEEIGKNLIYGLDAGIEETADTSEKSFEEIASNDQWLQGIYDSYETFDKKLLNLMSGMTENIVEMFNKMNVQIEDSIASLSKMAELNELNTKLSKINTSTPDIVTGKRMPSNKNFSTNVTVNNDYKGLSDVLKQAFVDAIKETANLQTNDGNIIVNIDGKNIFQAVRDQNTIYKKQHGVSALA